MQQIYMRLPMSKYDFNKFEWKSHFGIGVLQEICRIFSGYLFLRTPVSEATTKS